MWWTTTAFPKACRSPGSFATEAQKTDALAQGQDALMRTLTRAALDQAGIDMEKLIAPVRFDSEEACKRSDGGDWQRRLARSATTRH